VTFVASSEVQHVVEDFERLWTVAGFAEQFAATMARPVAVTGAPHEIVLDEHHRLLVAALRRARQNGEIAGGRGLHELADALVGFYLIRRLGRGSLDGWARIAIKTVVDAEDTR